MGGFVTIGVKVTLGAGPAPGDEIFKERGRGMGGGANPQAEKRPSRTHQRVHAPWKAISDLGQVSGVYVSERTYSLSVPIGVGIAPNQ